MVRVLFRLGRLLEDIYELSAYGMYGDGMAVWGSVSSRPLFGPKGLMRRTLLGLDCSLLSYPFLAQI